MYCSYIKDEYKRREDKWLITQQINCHHNHLRFSTIIIYSRVVVSSTHHDTYQPTQHA